MNINFEKVVLTLFLFLFLFSNLLERITNLKFNTLFYIVYFLIIFVSIRYIELNKMNKWIIMIIVFYFLYTFINIHNIKANILSIKDIIIPITCLFIPYILIKYKKLTINLMNILYMPFISYGIVQEAVFYKGEMGTILPWDNSIIYEMVSSGDNSNMFQPGGLLRFWGAMNSFVDFQICVVFIICLVWLYKDLVEKKTLLKLNLLLMVIFLCLAIERSPILMMLILMLFWKFKEVFTNIKKIIIVVIVSLVCMYSLSAFLNKISDNERIGGAYSRLYNVITLNFSNDNAIQDRKENQWKKDKKILLNPETFFGLGPVTVAPSSQEYFDGYIGPHNNFFGYYIGYGFLGLFLFICFLIITIKVLNKLRNKYKYYGLGTIAAFCCMAIFNMPFFGKQGIMFFLTMGVLINDKENYIAEHK